MIELLKSHTRSDSPEATEKIAELLGSQLKGGEVIELAGDMGAGKTTFVRGLARGMGSQDRVSSPTFTVSKIYNSSRLSLRHYDFYRLDDLKIITNELAETTEDTGSSVVLEWADNLLGVLDPEHIRVRIEAAGDQLRDLHFTVPEKYKYIKIKQ